MALPGLSGVGGAPAPQGEIPAHQVSVIQMIMILILNYNWPRTDDNDSHLADRHRPTDNDSHLPAFHDGRIQARRRENRGPLPDDNDSHLPFNNLRFPSIMIIILIQPARICLPQTKAKVQ